MELKKGPFLRLIKKSIKTSQNKFLEFEFKLSFCVIFHSIILPNHWKLKRVIASLFESNEKIGIFTGSDISDS